MRGKHFLADASAKLVDEFGMKDHGDSQDKATETIFSVGTKPEPRKDRRYYITVFILEGGKQTHIGEMDGKRGLGNVLADGKPSTVKVIAGVVR